MYSDSIKQKQQELLDVLFKKASGSPLPSPSPAPVLEDKGTTPPETPATPEGGGSTPPTPTPTPTPTPAPSTPKKEDEKGNPEIDPVALAKALFDKAMRHKATSLGGLGGAGLGLMLGKSIPGRLLWGLLGGLGGAGLGYAAEKYIK